MKTFLKMFFTLVVAICLLGAGYYLTFNNVSRLLAAGNPHWQCHWIATGLLIKTGDWREVVDLRPPLKVTRQVGCWILQGDDFTLKVMTKPKLRFQWKKSVFERRSIQNGEY